MAAEGTEQDAWPGPVARWHRVASSRDVDAIGGLLADDVVFRSPAVHTPVEGREGVTAYLRAAMAVLGPTLDYHRHWYAADTAVLEFTADLGGVEVHGIDLLSWREDGLLTEFTVMVRPFKAINHLIGLMGAELKAMSRDR